MSETTYLRLAERLSSALIEQARASGVQFPGTWALTRIEGDLARALACEDIDQARAHIRDRVQALEASKGQTTRSLEHSA